MSTDPTSESFFDEKYRQASDPWKFASNSYELDRYDAIVAALAGRRYQRGFEPGCSIGVLTERLAALCDSLAAIDISLTAVNRARQRCRQWPNLAISHGALPDAIPGGTFDLVVLSEIGYYFEPRVLDRISRRLVEQLNPGGVLLAAHWLGESADHRIGGNQVHDIIGATSELVPIASQCYEKFRIDRWTRK